jgi:hypothetical protein
MRLVQAKHQHWFSEPFQQPVLFELEHDAHLGRASG